MNEQNTPELTLESDGVILIYDGQCPFCQRYARLLRLKETCGPLQLINAREPHVIVKQVVEQGYDLDQGMITIINGKISHGDEAMNQLALLSTNSGLFNKFNYLLFRSETASKLLYPALRSGRNMVLKLLGISKIHSQKN